MGCQVINYKLEKPPKYQYVDTGMGIWKTYEFENGVRFKEFTSHMTVGELPLISVTSGIHPETGKTAVARGVLAVGQRSEGIFAVGQLASGYLAVGQLVTARIAGVGQVCVAPLAVGQCSIALAAITQIGVVGTGIMQSGVAFFGGLGQAVIDLGQFLF